MQKVGSSITIVQSILGSRGKDSLVLLIDCYRPIENKKKVLVKEDVAERDCDI